MHFVLGFDSRVWVISHFIDLKLNLSTMTFTHAVGDSFRPLVLHFYLLAFERSIFPKIRNYKTFDIFVLTSFFPKSKEILKYIFVTSKCPILLTQALLYTQDFRHKNEENKT